MTLAFYGHPFSSYCWKAMIALHEKDVDFAFRMIDQDHPENGAMLREVWPIGRFPLLLHDGHAVFEATAIVEYVDTVLDRAPRLIPIEPIPAVEVRQLDRVFDNYVMNVMQVLVNNRMRPEDRQDEDAKATARKGLDTIYAYLDGKLGKHEWAHPFGFSLADCAAAPSLFYADWVHPIPVGLANLTAYRARLLARPSMAKCVEGARPYRHFFPGGAPDRD